MKLKVSEVPMVAHIGADLSQAIRDFEGVNARMPSRIVMDLQHTLAFREIYTPHVIPGEDINHHRATFHGVPVAYSKDIEGIILED